jgi:hypothetical protein
MKKIIWETPEIHFNDLTQHFESDDVESSHEEEMSYEMQFGEKNQYFSTPFGLFEINDPFSPIKRTELRLGNTNFDINHNVAKIINDCEGVDSFRVISRYSFIIGIGKAFSFTQVRKKIEEELGCSSGKENLNSEVEALLEAISDKKYAVFIFPNGNYQYITSESPDFEVTLANFKILKEKVDGILIENSQ